VAGCVREMNAASGIWTEGCRFPERVLDSLAEKIGLKIAAAWSLRKLVQRIEISYLLVTAAERSVPAAQSAAA
jgi:hypothetical protein